MMTELQLETLQLITSHPPFDEEYKPPKKKKKAFQAHPVSTTELVQELVRIQEVVFCRWIKPSKTSYNNSPLRQDPAQEPMITLSGTPPILPGQHQAYHIKFVVRIENSFPFSFFFVGNFWTQNFFFFKKLEFSVPRFVVILFFKAGNFWFLKKMLAVFNHP